MNIGDKVHPTRIIPISNKKNMFEDEIGTVVRITNMEDSNQMITVKRDRDGEIFEQPEAVSKTILPRIENGKIKLDDIEFTSEQLKAFRKIYIVACGSAYHVGIVGKYILEKRTN